MLNYSDTNFDKANSGGNNIIKSSLKECYQKVSSSPVSIKIPVAGNEIYTVNGTEYNIAPNYYLLVNRGDEVKVVVDSNELVQGKCIYLDDRLVNSYYEEMTCKALFEDHRSESKLELTTGKYIYDDSILSTQLSNIKSNQQGFSNDHFYDKIAINLVLHQVGIKEVFSRLASINKATKLELYNRANIAKTYIQDNFTDDVTIDELSRVACISKFHLIRIFKNIVGCTPYNYLLKLRLQKSYEMLQKTPGISIQEVALTNGFNQRRTFTRSFKKEFGFCPNNMVVNTAN